MDNLSNFYKEMAIVQVSEVLLRRSLVQWIGFLPAHRPRLLPELKPF